MIVRENWEIVFDALALKPSGLFTDIDGTISAVAPTPDEASVDPEAAELLAVLSSRLSVVAAITGRATEYARDMVGVPSLLYSGNHGLEEVVDGEVLLIPEVRPYAGRLGQIFAEARPNVTASGLLWEEKSVTGTVHFRQSPDPVAAQEELIRVLRPVADRHGFVLHEGRMIIELRPEIELGKGAAARRIIERHGLHGCVFIGDDVTDVDAFRMLRAMRDAGQVAAVCVGVTSAETPASVLELADVTVPGVPGVIELLNWLERNL
ncbi:MAG: trehalose-phosphatase [Chloroflexota bacterium]|nr:trehalose-phosphatase [Chloroflexota bacterium]